VNVSQHTIDHTVIDFTVMYATHDAFRRDLTRLVAAATSGKAGTPQVRAGWENFKHQLDIHHTVEDTELWPRVERAVADRPGDLALMQDMKAEHTRLDPLLKAVDEAMAHQTGDLAEQVRELSAVLGDHMKHEEHSALPLIQDVLTPKDWDAFRSVMARRQGLKGAAVYIPWIIDGIGAEDRRKFLAAMPAPVKVINRLFWQSRYDKRNLWNT
jgi:hemerythrin-like domain-containing protein